MQDNGPTDNREDVDFRKLLEDVIEDRQSFYELFDLLVFKQRLNSICRFSTDSAADAEELYDLVLYKVSQNIAIFEPDFEADEYGKFFRWLAVIARHATCDNLRRKKVKLDDRRPEEIFNLVDPGISPELVAERAERDRRFRTFITNLESERDRKILQYALEGLSLREVASKLLAAGISCSHTTVANVIRRMLARFFANEDLELHLPRKPDKSSLRGREPEAKPTEERTEVK
jgi:RNA polymerase sigma factor (sigma-70 family)